MLLFVLHEEFDPRSCFGNGHPHVRADVKTCPQLIFHGNQSREPGFAEVGRDKRKCPSERFRREIEEGLVVAYPKFQVLTTVENSIFRQPEFFNSIRSSFSLFASSIWSIGFVKGLTIHGSTDRFKKYPSRLSDRNFR